jgi:3-isopropylmalate dehydratase small subunit
MFITSPFAKIFSMNSKKKCLKFINKKSKLTFKMNLENLNEFEDSELDPETKKAKRKTGGNRKIKSC